jgi:uroporphyrinogen-III synthase
MRLLVTRPVDDAGPLAEKLQGLGHEAVILPLLAIKPKDTVEIPDMAFQALCTTSANGLLCRANLSSFYHLPFYAIGPQSAGAARHLGFTHVSGKGGNVEGLVQYICKHAKPDAGPLLYLSGAETTGDLEGKLKAHGFSVARVVVYDAVPEAVADLAQRIANADGVLLYSPRSAKLWCAQVAEVKAVDVTATLTHYCLSANVAANLPKHWTRRISPTPDEGGMLSILDHNTEAE